MSHEIWTPTIIECASGRTLLHIRQHGIDGRPQWRPDGFTLGLRCYDHSKLWLGLTVDAGRDCFRFDGSEVEEPLEALGDRVDEELRRQIDPANRRADRRRVLQVARDVAVVLLFVVAIGALIWFGPA